MKFPAESILVIRMSGVGDVLWSTPMLANLRRAYPRARIGYVVRSSCVDVLRGNPDVDEILEFSDPRISRQIAFLAGLWRRRFDLSIDLICSPGTAIQSLLSRARIRIGYDFRVRKHLYNHVLSAREANAGHEVEFNLYALRYLEVPIVTTDLVWIVSPEERAQAEEVWTRMGFTPSEQVAGLVPTGGFPSKQWPVLSYAELARRIAAEFNMRSAVFWGTEQERRDAEILKERAGESVVLVPRLGLRSLATVIARCAAVVGNDSGPLHLATALRVPVLGLYGPTNEKSQGPWGPNARTVREEHLSRPCCRKADCADPVCMKELRVDKVFGALRDLLSGPGMAPAHPSLNAAL